MCSFPLTIGGRVYVRKINQQSGTGWLGRGKVQTAAGTQRVCPHVCTQLDRCLHHQLSVKVFLVSEQLSNVKLSVYIGKNKQIINFEKNINLFIDPLAHGTCTYLIRSATNYHPPTDPATQWGCVKRRVLVLGEFGRKPRETAIKWVRLKVDPWWPRLQMWRLQAWLCPSDRLYLCQVVNHLFWCHLYLMFLALCVCTNLSSMTGTYHNTVAAQLWSYHTHGHFWVPSSHKIY